MLDNFKLYILRQIILFLRVQLAVIHSYQKEEEAKKSSCAMKIIANITPKQINANDNKKRYREKLTKFMYN